MAPSRRGGMFKRNIVEVLIKEKLENPKNGPQNIENPRNPPLTPIPIWGVYGMPKCFHLATLALRVHF